MIAVPPTVTTTPAVASGLIAFPAASLSVIFTREPLAPAAAEVEF